jgi:hypothetical protein
MPGANPTRGSAGMLNIDEGWPIPNRLRLGLSA